LLRTGYSEVRYKSIAYANARVKEQKTLYSFQIKKLMPSSVAKILQSSVHADYRVIVRLKMHIGIQINLAECTDVMTT